MRVCNENRLDNAQINILQHFSLYLDCQSNHYEVDLLGNPTFNLIPFSSWIKNSTQQKPFKQKKLWKNLFPLKEKENLTDNINMSEPLDLDSKNI